MFTLSTIFGQDDALDSIRRAYAADRLPHGLIFAGPVGVGKGTTAAALAALFLCEKPTAARPCGTCPSCRVFEAQNHPDYHIITKELIRYHDRTGKSKGIDLSINVIRPELIEPASRKSVLNRGKVFIIEQAELLTPQAQNAMLKTLEEPAGRTLIILLTDQPDSLLPTIRSRCQTIRFAALSDDVVRSHLQKSGTEKTMAAAAANFAEGSLGLALKWIEEGVVSKGGELIRHVDALLAGRGAADWQDWFKKSADDYAEKQLERDPLASKEQATREGLALYLRLTGQRLRRLLAEHSDPQELDRVCDAIDAVARAEQYLDANVNVPLIFQQLAISLERTFAPAAA